MYEKLEEVRKSKNLSVHKLAQLSSITPQCLYSALKGERKMWEGWKKRLAETLETSVEELFPSNGKGV